MLHFAAFKEVCDNALHNCISGNCHGIELNYVHNSTLTTINKKQANVVCLTMEHLLLSVSYSLNKQN